MDIEGGVLQSVEKGDAWSLFSNDGVSHLPRPSKSLLCAASWSLSIQINRLLVISAVLEGQGKDTHGEIGKQREEASAVLFFSTSIQKVKLL